MTISPNIAENASDALACNFGLPEDLDHSQIRQVLEPHYAIRLKPESSRSLTFYDSFDWRLWLAGMVLHRAPEDLVLSRRADGWLGRSCAALQLAAEQPMPVLVADFPSGPLYGRLEKLLELRGLLQVASFELRERTLELLDESRKVVVRVELVMLDEDGAGRNVHKLCRVRPLRGYDQDASHVVELVTAKLGISPPDAGPLDAYFVNHGKQPAPYTLKPDFGLQASMSAREAVCQIVATMQAIARSNEGGIINDIDTEFLHDFRICIRKIRSVLSLIKDIFPEESTRKLKQAYSEIGKRTNRLRDLDVYLLNPEQYKQFLPGQLQDGVDAIAVDYSAERERECKAVANYLRSADYRKTVDWLNEFFANPAKSPPTEHSQLPLLPLISQRIRKRYRRIVKISKGLDPSTPDESIHQLRIHCKKLRYLLEFFQELFAAESVAVITRQLRRLQNTLGKFNDYSVQQQDLVKYWHDHHTERQDDPDLAMSIGGLIGALHSLQQEQRKVIEKRLSAFCSRKAQARLDELTRAGQTASSGKLDTQEVAQ